MMVSLRIGPQQVAGDAEGPAQMSDILKKSSIYES